MSAALNLSSFGFNSDIFSDWGNLSRRDQAARSASSRHPGVYQANTGAEQLDVVSLWSKVESQFNAIGGLTRNWDSYGGIVPTPTTIAFALAELNSLKSMDLMAPIVTASGGGEILAAWSGGGIEVEIWFKSFNEEVVVIDDEREEVASVAGADPLLVSAIHAIREISRRQ